MEGEMIKYRDIKAIDIIYYLLLTSIYFTDFFYVEASKYLIAFLIPFSFYLIFRKKRYELILINIIASRTVNAFFILDNPQFYDIINWTFTLIPALILIIIKVEIIIAFYKSRIKKYKYSFFFLLIMVIYSLINPSDLVFIFNVRVLPFILFILLLPIIAEKINFTRLMYFYIIYFGLTLFVFFQPTYHETEYYLLTQKAILRENIISYQSSLGDLLRNQGVTFDARLTGIFSYIFLMIFLFFGKKHIKIIGAILAFTIVLLTLSRGATIVALLIIIGFIFEYASILKILKNSVLILLSVFLVGYLAIELKIVDSEYLNTFNIISSDETNAISQRNFMAEFAKEKFMENPFGMGMGALKANEFDLFYASKVSDAYWYILLAEIGFIGVFFFFMSCYELIFFSKSAVVKFFFVGYLIQLYGTDIPDSRIFYLPIIMLLHQIVLKKKNEYENIGGLPCV